MNNRKLLRIICIGLFLLILISMQAWFFAWVSNITLAVFEVGLILIMFVYLNNNKKTSSKSNLYILAAVFLFFVGLFNRSSTIVTIVSYALVVSIMYLLMRFPQDAKNTILQFATKWFSLLLLISVAAWLIHFVVSLPNIGNVYYADNRIGESINYIFFTDLPSDIRFKSVFLEPGHVSSVAAFFVIANRFIIFGNNPNVWFGGLYDICNWIPFLFNRNRSYTVCLKESNTNGFVSWNGDIFLFFL